MIFPNCHLDEDHLCRVTLAPRSSADTYTRTEGLVGFSRRFKVARLHPFSNP